MFYLILTLHIVLSFAIIGLVLLQRGKGADIGASFGSGASQTVFGPQGATSLFGRVTALLTALFFATSFGLSLLAQDSARQAGLLPAAGESEVQEQEVQAPPEIPSVEDPP